MSAQLTLDSHTGWEVKHRGQHSLGIEHEDDGVAVTIDPVYRGSTHQKKRKGARPRSYRVNLKQDWFGTALFSDQNKSGTTEEFSEALALTQSFITQYESNRQGVDDDYKRDDIGMESVNAEDLIATEAATETVLDVVGYSDTYLVETLQNLFGDALVLALHRFEDDVERVFAREDTDVEKLAWAAGTISNESKKYRHLLPVEEIHTVTIHAGKYRWFRFVSSPSNETVVVAEDHRPVEIASIERTVQKIIEKRYTTESRGMSND